MHLEIVTPEENIFNGEVELIQVPGTDGSFEILENHAAILSTLDRGLIKVRKINGEEYFFEVEGGVIECKKNKITVLAD